MDHFTKLLPKLPNIWGDSEAAEDRVDSPPDENVKVKNKETVAYGAPSVNPAFEADNDDNLNGSTEKPVDPDEREKPEKTDNPAEPVAGVTPTNYGTIQAPTISVAPTPPKPARKISYQRPTIEENLAAEMAIKRRHSDFGVISSPRPPNEDLALKGWNSGDNLGTMAIARGNDAIDAVKGKRHSMDTPRGRGPQWSPRLARKMDATKKENDNRRRTLAELAVEAGYQGPDIDEVDSSPKKLAGRDGTEDVGEDAVFAVKVAGEIYLDLGYEMKSKTFTVHLHSANNLAAVEAKAESSDPYVKTYLLPDRKSKRKTKTKKGTLNPEFDESLLYTIGYDDLMTRILWTSVWHSDRMGRNVFLGEVRIPIGPLVDSGYSLQSPEPKWFTLGQKSEESATEAPPSELILSLKYVTADKVRKKGKKGSVAAGDKGELHVHVMEAKNLPGKDHDGMSDPYCKGTLLPDKKGKSKFKTPFVKRNLNPSFDYKFVVEDQSVEDLKSKVLEITLWDHDLASSDEFLGGVRLGLGTSSNPWDDSNTDEAQIWQTILSRHNVWVQVVLRLRAEMKEGHKL